MFFFGLEVSKDLIIYTKQEFETEDTTRLSYKIKHEGKKIYAKAFILKLLDIDQGIF
jgi:hypothetical protein